MLPGDAQTVKLHFFSSASAFVYAALKLCYTDHGGNYLERDIPVRTMPSGLQYNTEQLVDIPSLSVLGLTAGDLETDKKNMKLKIELRNAAGTVSTFEEPFSLAASQLTRCSIALPAESDAEKGMPVRIAIGNLSKTIPLANVSLHWKASGGTWQTMVLEDGSRNLISFRQDVYLRDMIGDVAWATEAGLNWGRGSFQCYYPAHTFPSMDKLWVGAVEGSHLTRALYNYIRVVRVKDPAVTPVPRD